MSYKTIIIVRLIINYRLRVLLIACSHFLWDMGRTQEDLEELELLKSDYIQKEKNLLLRFYGSSEEILRKLRKDFAESFSAFQNKKKLLDENLKKARLLNFSDNLIERFSKESFLEEILSNLSPILKKGIEVQVKKPQIEEHKSRSAKKDNSRSIQEKTPILYSQLDYSQLLFHSSIKNTNKRGVRDLIITKDESKIAVASSDCTVQVFELKTKTHLLSLHGHTDAIWKIIQLHDERIATASADKTIRVWNLQTGMCEKVLEGHTDAVFCLLELQNSMLLSGSKDGYVKCWDLTRNWINMVRVIYAGAELIFSMIHLEKDMIVLGKDPNILLRAEGIF